MRQVISRK